MINTNNEALNIISSIQQKELTDNNISLISQNPLNQSSFLQKKRLLEIDNNYEQNLLQLIANSTFLTNYLLNEYRRNLGFYSQLTNPLCIYDNNSNLNKLVLNNFSHIYPNSLFKEYIINNSFINNNIYTENNNMKENQLNDLFSNNFNIEKNKEIFNYKTNNANERINDNNVNDSKIPGIPPNKPKLNNNCLFKITHVRKSKNKKREFRKKYIKQMQNNNEIKVLKNNKVVYVNTFLLKSYSTSKNIQKFNKIKFVERNKRSSRFRGVSKNGNQWQVLIMINKKKSYIGSFSSEELAARIYDIFALKNRGLKARTNFKYTSQQIKKICEINIDIKEKNISETISQLIV